MSLDILFVESGCLSILLEKEMYDGSFPNRNLNFSIRREPSIITNVYLLQMVAILYLESYAL